MPKKAAAPAAAFFFGTSMAFSHLASIFDSIVGNLVTPVASHGLRKLSSLVAVPQAIAAVEKEMPFTGAAQVLASWAEAIDVPDAAPDCLQMLRSSDLVVLYQNIAKVAGAASDEETALKTIERFYVQLDRRLLNLTEHERRERNRFNATLDHISSTAAEQTKTLTAEFTQQIQSMRAEVQKLTPVERSAATAKRLAAVEALIDAGQFRAAKTKLDQPQDGSDTVEDLVARSTLEGICRFRLGDLEGSLSSFQRVRTLKATSAVAASNVAAALLALGDAERALGEALAARALDPSLAPLNYLGALHALGKDAEVFTFLNDEAAGWKDDSAFQTAAARIYLETNHVTEAIAAARQAVAITPTVDAKEVLALALLSQHDFSRSRTPRAVLREAEQLLSQCIEERYGWQTRDQLNSLLTNRAVARGLLRDFDAALLDCDSVLAHDNFEPALATKGRLLANVERWVAAIGVFAQLKDPDLRRDTAMTHAEALLNARRAKEAIAMVSSALDDDGVPLGLALSGLQVALASANALNDISLATDLICKVVARGAVWAARAANGYAMLARGETDHAIEELTGAAMVAPESDRPLLLVGLARALTRAARPRAAASIYESIANNDTDIEILESYVTALFRSKQYSKAAAVSDRYLSSGIESSRLRSIRGLVYEYVGDLAAAAMTYEDEGNAANEPSFAYLQAAQLRTRLRQMQQARDLALRVEPKELRDRPRDLMALAEVYDAVGIDPMPLAYSALALSNTPDVPAAYVTLASSWLGPSHGDLEVRDNTTVVLAGQSNAIVRISSDPLDEWLPDHYSLSSPIARALLGKRKGDVVEVMSSGSMLRMTIEKVADKWRYAFEQAIESSPARFGAAAMIGPLSAGGVASETHDRARRERLTTRYRTQQISIGRLADLSGQPMINAYCAEMLSSDGLVHAFGGNQAEAEGQCIALTSEQAIVLDLTSLVTFARLELLDRLPKVFTSIFVSQLVVDQLLLTMRHLFPERRGGVIRRATRTATGVVAVDEGLCQRELRVVERALSFVATVAYVVPYSGLLKMEQREIVTAAKIYGRVSLTSVLIAFERKVPVVVDDLVCQWQLAAGGHTSVNSHTILQTMVRGDVISPIEYENALLRLHKLNFHFLRISAADLYLLLRVSADDDVSDFARLSGQLSNPACEIDSVIRVAARLLVSTWLSDLNLAKKIAATHVVLLAANVNRPLVIAYHVRDRFIEEFGPRWNVAGGRLDGVLKLFIESWRQWAEQVANAAAIVGRSSE